MNYEYENNDQEQQPENNGFVNGEYRYGRAPQNGQDEMPQAGRFDYYSGGYSYRAGDAGYQNGYSYQNNSYRTAGIRTAAIRTAVTRITAASPAAAQTTAEAVPSPRKRREAPAEKSWPSSWPS